MKRQASEMVISEVRPDARKKRLIIIAAAAVVVLVGGAVTWQYMHRHKELTAQQQQIKKGILDQQQTVNEEKQRHAPGDVQAVTYGNLAESNAALGQCKEARDALAQAQKLASAELQTSIKDTEKTVNAHC